MSADARREAVNALVRTEDSGYSNLVLKSAGLDSLSPENRAFCTGLVYGTLSRIYTLDALLTRCVNRPLQKLDAPVRSILRSGLYQILFMDSVPVHSAVDESVKLTRVFGKSSAASFVNAVLRAAAKLKLEDVLSGINERKQLLSVKYSVHPQLAELLLEQYPESCMSMLAATLEPVQYWLRVNSLVATREEVIELLAKQSCQAQSGFLVNSLCVHSAAAALALQQSGKVRVQGLWSQYAAACVDCRAGETVFDVCAAPGGKSATMAQYMRNSGKLLAMDKNERRLKLAEELFYREGITIAQLHTGDAGVFDPTLGEADRVLCDVPCSGYGMLAYKPELRQKAPADIAELPKLQYEILSTCSRYVKKGGKLVYSTCTVNRNENEAVVRRFLAEHKGFAPAAPAVSAADFVLDKTAAPFISVLPQQQSCSGFFVATLERMC